MSRQRVEPWKAARLERDAQALAASAPLESIVDLDRLGRLVRHHLRREIFAWHYTTARCALGIVASGRIRGATVGVPRGEKAAVWFTTYEHFEPTARKALVTPDGSFVGTATLADMCAMDGGLVRLGMRAAAPLLPWSDLARRRIGMRAKTQEALEEVARKQGSDPSAWWIHIGALRVDKIERVEWFDVENDTWLPSEGVGADGMLDMPVDVARFFDAAPKTRRASR